MTNTASLNTPNPNTHLSFTFVPIASHATPNSNLFADQKSGPAPLRECINDTTFGCWQLFFATEPSHNEPIAKIIASDHQHFYANGKLWNALTTSVSVNNQTKVGILWVIINLSVSANGVSATLAKQGFLALANNNLMYPSIAINANGKGVMGFTISGQDYFPSTGYVSFDAKHGVGPVHVVANGLGPEDGFTGYQAFGGGAASWGDFGNGAVDSDGKTLWIANEYIGQTCTLAQYLDPSLGFLSCDHTRTALTNWYTHITKLQTQ